MAQSYGVARLRVLSGRTGRRGAKSTALLSVSTPLPPARRSMDESAISRIELRVGVVEGRWSPLAAQQAV